MPRDPYIETVGRGGYPSGGGGEDSHRHSRCRFSAFTPPLFAWDEGYAAGVAAERARIVKKLQGWAIAPRGLSAPEALRAAAALINGYGAVPDAD